MYENNFFIRVMFRKQPVLSDIGIGMRLLHLNF